MEEEKVCMLADDEGNLFRVKDWDRLFNEVPKNEIEDLYVVSKYFHSFEKAMIQLEEKGLVEPVTEVEGDSPLNFIANSLNKLSEHIGVERIKELDIKVDELFDQRSNNINPSNFLHLN